VVAEARAGEELQAYILRGQPHDRFVPEATALLVIDPVNDFLSEGGAAWEMSKSTVERNHVVENLRRVIDGARDRGVAVLFAPMAYTEEDYADRELHRRSGINRVMFEQKMFLAGSWGADFHPELRPRDDEAVLLPHKGIDVFETDLPHHLERLGTRHLVICGMTANLCCESTGRHAMEVGYDVTFLSDAIGAENLANYEASIHVNYPQVGNAVMEVVEFLAAVDEARPIRAGDTVRASDRGKIGEVEEMAEATDATDAYLLVKRGLLQRDTYIPLDAVVKRAGSEVFINVPKLVVGKMPWDQPPSRDEQRSKLGPPGGEVDQLYGSVAPSVHGQSS
jgi:ureidoacrylate peracid hydrolase